MMGELIARNLLHRPLRTIIGAMGIAVEVALVVLIVGLTVNLLVWWGGSPPVIASPIAALFFVHTYLPLDAASMSFVHTWSLAVEEHAYLLLMLIALL